MSGPPNSPGRVQRSVPDRVPERMLERLVITELRRSRLCPGRNDVIVDIMCAEVPFGLL